VREADQLGRRGFNLGRASSLSETRERSVGLQTLRLDGCSLRPTSLDAISKYLLDSSIEEEFPSTFHGAR
jgi:hypothetical protein